MSFQFSRFIRDAVLTVHHYNQVITFTREHKLWKGIMNYRWLSKLFILLGVVLSLKFIDICIQWWDKATASGMSLSSVGNLFNSIFSEGYNLFAIGGMKYVILILLEVVIFHFARRTLEVMTGDEYDHSFKAFLRAQNRMIGISIYSFIMESILALIATILLSIIGLKWLNPGTVILIQCYFLGFAIVDNYNEIFNMTLKQSTLYTRQYAAVALITGIVVYLLMIVPVIGTILGPLSGAIAATITMHELTQKDNNMAWVFEKKPK